MNRLFTPYQESLELKQLEFDEPCLAYYKIWHDNKFLYLVE